jgi:hypothetical protein
MHEQQWEQEEGKQAKEEEATKAIANERDLLEKP